MYRHNRLDAAVKLSLLEGILQVYWQKPGLPVMAVNDIGTKIYHRKRRKSRLVKEGKFLDILINLPVWLIPIKIEFIIKKINDHPVIFHLKDTDILLSPCQFKIEMGYIFHLILIFLWNRHILGNHYPHIKFILIKIFRQGSHYISQTAGFNKWHTFRSNK